DGWLIEGLKSARETLRSAEEISAISREYGFPIYVGVGDLLRGFCVAALEQPADGVPLLLEGLSVYRDTGANVLIPFYLTMLADVYARAGQPEEGLNRLADAAKLVETTKERWAEAEMHRLRGDLLNARGDRAAAERCYWQARSVARQQNARLFELLAPLAPA